jgi:hypothetical protein
MRLLVSARKSLENNNKKAKTKVTSSQILVRVTRRIDWMGFSPTLLMEI